jgi:hypothetical protein
MILFFSKIFWCRIISFRKKSFCRGQNNFFRRKKNQTLFAIRPANKSCRARQSENARRGGWPAGVAGVAGAGTVGVGGGGGGILNNTLIGAD